MTPKFKAVVLGCRACGNQRRFIVSEDEAGYIEAQFADQNPVLLFNAIDLTAMDAEGGGAFSQSLDRADFNGLQIFPLSDNEILMFQSQAQRAIRSGGSVRPITATAKTTPPVLSSLLGGVKK